MKIIWSPTARRKIDEIIDYISRDDIEAAYALVDDLEKRVDTLKRHPHLGRMVSIINDEMIRELIVTANYSVIYEVNGAQIDILTIRHARENRDV